MLSLATWPRSAWSIFDELESLQEDMTQMLSGRAGLGSGRPWRGRQSYPLMNIWSSAEGVVIDAELPGVDPKDVDISVLGDRLTLQGKVATGEESDETTYHRRERPAGQFVRTLHLPFRADPGGVKASYTNGVLRITIPRSEEEKPRKIAIEAA
jgi:HSP20 family protein